jgi:hypothetical protein
MHFDCCSRLFSVVETSPSFRLLLVACVAAATTSQHQGLVYLKKHIALIADVGKGGFSQPGWIVLKKCVRLGELGSSSSVVIFRRQQSSTCSTC